MDIEKLQTEYTEKVQSLQKVTKELEIAINKANYKRQSQAIPEAPALRGREWLFFAKTNIF